MNKNFIKATVSRAADGRIEFIATDETLDRQGEVIPIDSWDLSNYLKNPVLLVNHEYKVQNIVGRAERVRVERRSSRDVMVFEPVFHGLTQLSKEVEAMVNEGVLATVSVGFLRRMPNEDGDKQLNELMEISFVPVPANPSAERIRSFMDPALSEMELAAVKSFAETGALPEKEEKEGRTLSAKNRRLISEARDALSALLDATEPEKDEPSKGEQDPTEDLPVDDAAEGTEDITEDSVHGETVDTPTDGKSKSRKGRAGQKDFERRVIQHLVKIGNDALYKLNKRNDG